MKNETLTVGKSEIRKDAWDKVCGTALYTADLKPAGLLYGAVVRSPHHHARLKSLDASAALRVRGVRAVISAQDIPGARVLGDLMPDRPVLAFDEVRFLGEPVALVVAASSSAARRAAAAVSVEYEVLPAVFDPREALQPYAPRVHAQGNLCSKIEVNEGDMEGGMAQADLVIEEEFQTPRIYQAYMEMEASLAVWQEDGTLAVWVSSQKPFHDRHLIAEALGMPEEKVSVRIPAIGGAFGGKEDSSLHMLAALAAWKVKGAVQFYNSREESIIAHPKRHAAHLKYRVGVKRDGTLTAMDVTVHMDTGAYASYGPAVGQLLTETVCGPYRVPNVRVVTNVVYTNGVIAGAMRGFGSPQTCFAYESLMDMIAGRLGMDGVELRRRNIWRTGDRNFTRVIVNQPQAVEKCLESAALEMERLRAIPPAAGKKAGVGLALGLQTMGLGARVPDDSANRLEWLPDGRVLLYLGAPDLGQGLETVAAQMTAEALDIDYARIQVVPLDTASTPNGGVSCASRMTYMVGNSVRLAARQAIDTLLRETALRLNTEPDSLRYARGQVFTADGKSIPAQEITSRMAEEGRKIDPTGVFSFPYGPETPMHLPIGMPHVFLVLGAQVVRVEVDPQTGTIEATDVVAIHDVGKAINRTLVEGQIEGALHMGLGYALCEEVSLKPDGTWPNGLSEYLMLTPVDMPARIKTVILEEPEKTGPWGAKGIGEMGLVPTAPALANAVFQAVGKRVQRIPIKPEVVAE